MPWKEVTSMSEKLRFIRLAREPNRNMSQLCQQFGISRKTGYKLLERYERIGDSAFDESSRRPQTMPTKTPLKHEALIIALRDKHPAWGADKIRQYLLNEGFVMPSTKTVNRILKRYGRICIEESLKRKPFIRFEHEHPNDLWQMDFKGHFKLTNDHWCYPLTLLDDHSRYSLGIISCSNQQGNTVIEALKAIFREHGLPLRMTMDNGSPWGFSGDQQHTYVTAWLIKNGITVSHSRPCHPQTQGKLERFHRSLKAELLSAYTFDDIAHAQVGFDWWRELYNKERPHNALDMKVPIERYKKSARLYVEKLKPYVYDSNLEVRKVALNGSISYKGFRYVVGQAFGGHEVGLRMDHEHSTLDVYFCHQKVLKLNSSHKRKY